LLDWLRWRECMVVAVIHVITIHMMLLLLLLLLLLVVMVHIVQVVDIAGIVAVVVVHGVVTVSIIIHLVVGMSRRRLILAGGCAIGIVINFVMVVVVVVVVDAGVHHLWFGRRHICGSIHIKRRRMWYLNIIQKWRLHVDIIQIVEVVQVGQIDIDIGHRLELSRIYIDIRQSKLRLRLECLQRIHQLVLLVLW